MTDRKSLIFVHIQKTGGSSIAAAIGQQVLSPHKHRFANELKAIYGEDKWDSAYKFAFVRNPWDRLVSWWTMIETYRPKDSQQPALNNFFSYVYSNAQNFEEFIVNCKEDIEDNNGWKCIYRNQIDYLTDDSGGLMVDFIGKFENLMDDFNHVLTAAGWETRPLGHHNWTRHRPYQEYYTPRTRAIIEEAYARDIAAFGYRFEEA